MEKQKEKMKGLQESVARWDHYNQGDEVSRRSVFMLWQNYVIIALVLMIFLGGSENHRLNNEGDLNAVEIKRLKLKSSWNAETRNALNGFISGETNLLERVLTQNPHRDHNFPWSDWNPVIAEKCIRMALDANKMEPLHWVTQQPKWTSILSLETVNEVKSVLEPKQKALRLSGRSQSHWRRSIIAERDRLKSERDRLKSELANKIEEHKNARLFMFSLFWDSGEDFSNVVLEDLPKSWVDEYPRAIERLRQTGSTNVLPKLDTIDRALKRPPVAQDHPLGGSQ